MSSLSFFSFFVRLFKKKKIYLCLSHLGDLITSSEKFLVYYYYYFFNILICLLPILLRSITLIISIFVVVVVSHSFNLFVLVFSLYSFKKCNFIRICKFN